MSSRGAWVSHSIFGASDVINVIPTEDPTGVCHRILLACAHGTRGSKKGLKAVLRKVREHLIHCTNTDIVLIVTDNWVTDIINESTGDFETYRRNHGKTILGVLVNKGRITLQAL
jgi:uncharacterized protein YejL (UPF0352 family)